MTDFGDADASDLYPCPCCGYMTLHTQPPGTYLVCPICFWVDTGDERELRQAQRNFIEFGACDREWVQQVRHPTEQDARVPNWQSLDALAYQCSFECLHTLSIEDEAFISSIAISPDGNRLFAAYYNNALGEDSYNCIRVWDLNTGQLVHTFPGHSQKFGWLYIALSRDGKTLASIVGWDYFDRPMSDGIIVWDVSTGQRRRTIQTEDAHNLQISPDGQFLVTRVFSSTELWNLRIGEEFHGLQGYLDTTIRGCLESINSYASRLTMSRTIAA